MHHPTDRIIHNTTFVTPVVEHWLEREFLRRNQNLSDRDQSEVYVYSTGPQLVYCMVNNISSHRHLTLRNESKQICYHGDFDINNLRYLSW